MRWLAASLLWLAGTLLFAQDGGDSVQEFWDAAYLEGAKAGYYHTKIETRDYDGEKVFATTLSMNLRIRRYNAVVPLRMELSLEETADGKVLGVSMTHHLDKGTVVQTGKVEGGKLWIRIGQAPRAQGFAWDDRAIGLAAQERIFKEKQVKPGDRFSYLNYELSLLTPLTLHVTVKEPEEVDLLVPERQGDTVKAKRVTQKLLRAEVRADKVQVQGNAIQLPMHVLWLDKNLRTVRSQIELPGLGKVTLYRTTREIAQQEGAAPHLLPDLGLRTLISLNRAVPGAHRAKQIVYRITYKDDDDPATLFATDRRQSVKNLEGKTFDLHVNAVRELAEVINPPPVKAEYLAGSHFLDANDPAIKELAQRLAEKETDPLQKARRIEAWVHANMRVSAEVGFSTASQIVRDLKGDCRQHAMLTAALCRAAGVPSRTAMGLVYADDSERGAMLVFHMWTEVWIRGQWFGIDATLGQGSIGPGHLKISDHSWHDVQTLAPLLTSIRVIGNVKVEVARVE